MISRWGLVTTLLAVLVPICSSQQQPTPLPALGSAVIHVNDSLKVVVQNEPDLSGWVAVRPDGTISYPLVGTIQVVGLTTQALGELLGDRLRSYVKSPQATVLVESSEAPDRPRKWLSEPPRSKPFPLPPLFPSGV